MCNNSSLKEVVEPRPFGSTMSHYSLILVPEITFWSFSSIYSWKWVESEWCCFMCIFRLRSFFSSLLQRVQGVGRSKCLALACLLALLRSANWLPHILHSNLENKKCFPANPPSSPDHKIYDQFLQWQKNNLKFL